MASRGRTVAGSDGSDFQHRERVEPRYKQASENKEKLRKLLPMHMLYFATMAAVSVYQFQSLQTLPFHPPFYAAALLPLIAYRAIPKSSILLLAIFALLAGLSAAYILAIGVGRNLTVFFQLNPGSPLAAGLIVLHILGMAAHFLAMYYARTLISLSMHPPRSRQSKRD